MITDHVFRTSGAQCTSSTGSQGGIAFGMCAWLGTCNRPREEHAPAPTRPGRPAGTRVLDETAERRIVRDYTTGRLSMAAIAAKHGVSVTPIRAVLRRHGVVSRGRGGAR